MAGEELGRALVTFAAAFIGCSLGFRFFSWLINRKKRKEVEKV